MTSNTVLISLKDLRATHPAWPFSAWWTGDLIRRGLLGCVRSGRRVFVTAELLEAYIQAHVVQPESWQLTQSDQ